MTMLGISLGHTSKPKKPDANHWAASSGPRDVFVPEEYTG
jgi:hypothetical protein